MRHLAVITSGLGISTCFIDIAVTQVGLTKMQASLGISVVNSQWILNLFFMILAGTLTIGGALGDRFGRVRMLRFGIILIITGAVITFTGGLLSWFIIVLAGRAIQGFGASFIIPAATALLLDVFPLGERGVAQGKMMVISMTVAAFAQMLVGVIIQAISWQYAYLLTVLTGIMTLIFSFYVKYEQKKTSSVPFDYFGSFFVFLTISFIIIAIMQIGIIGLLRSAILFAAGLVSGIVLILVSLRKKDPLIQFSLFKNRNILMGLFVNIIRFFPNILMSVFVARYLQEVLGVSPTFTGILIALPVFAQVATSPFAGKMLDRLGPRKPVALGIGLLAAGLIMLGTGFPAQNLWVVISGAITGGAGFGFTNPVQISTLNQAPLEKRGMLAGIFPMTGQFGSTLSVALLTAGMIAFINRSIKNNPGIDNASAQANSLGIIAWLCLAVTIIAFIISLFLQNKSPETNNFCKKS